jgi:hypothetical protein
MTWATLKQSTGQQMVCGIFVVTVMATAHPALADPPDAPPLSPAQIALFETPHLHNVARTEALEYRFERTGADAFQDKVTARITEIHPDGTKLVSFDFLTGDRHEFYPAVDEFKGNPVLMVFLEHDVRLMKQQIGIASAYFRNRVREALVDRATVEDTTWTLDGKSVPARRIKVKPFASDDRLEQLPSVQQKEYSFVICDQAPGELVELAASMPADPKTGAPAWSDRLTFTGERP